MLYKSTVLGRDSIKWVLYHLIVIDFFLQKVVQNQSEKREDEITKLCV